MALWEPPPTGSAPERTPQTPRNPPTPGAAAAGSYAATPPQDSPRPDSPGGSPAPEGTHGDIEMELVALANALYNLGTSVVNDNSREKPGPDGQRPDKRIGARVNEVVQHLATIDDLSQDLTTQVPMEVLAEIDGGHNPTKVTAERIERLATEHQFMNAKLDAIASYVEMLDEALAQNFPELAPHLFPKSPENDGESAEAAATAAGEPTGEVLQPPPPVKMEEDLPEAPPPPP